jgi:phosphopantetheinyl transferase
MPLCYKENLANDGIWGIWEIKEEEDWFFNQWQLSSVEHHHFSKLKGQKRLEYLSSRHLVHVLTELENRIPIHTDNVGKPYFDLNPNLHLSISHSHGYAAAILSKTIKVGVDIQLIVPQMIKVAKRVFNEKELSFIPKEKELEMLHVFWGIKEAVFKAYGIGGLDFKEQICIQPFEYLYNSGNFEVFLIKENQQLIYKGLYHFLPKGYVSTYLFEEKQG